MDELSLHPWDISPAEVIDLQQELRERIVADRPRAVEDVHLVPVVDASMEKHGSEVFAAGVEMSFPELELV